MPKPSEPTTPTPERPLSAMARLLLVLSTILLLLVFYVAVAASVLYLVIAAFCGIAIGITIGLRLGFAGWMLGGAGAMGTLALMMVRSFFLGKSAEYHLPISREDAPRLFEVVEEVARELKAPIPNEILLDPDLNAAVSLKGYMRARGRCRLVLGYDLLAALPPEEVRGVIAHELAHALLIQRGYWAWSVGGVSRMVTLSRLFEAVIANTERFYTAQTIRWGIDRMALLGVRLAATYLRQDEFDADAAAARLCGADVYARGLVRVQLASDLADVSWRERVIQSQREGSYCAWLRERFRSHEAPDPGLLLSVTTNSTTDPMSTHPALPHRLAALPGVRSVFPQPFTRSGAEAYLRDPDEAAQRLIDRLEETAADEQRAENRELLKGIRARHGRSRRNGFRKLAGWLIGIGIFLFLLGLLLDLGWWRDGLGGMNILILACIGGGAWLLAATRVRDPEPLPVFPIHAIDALIRQDRDVQEYRPLPPTSLPIWPASTASRVACVVTLVLGLAGLASWVPLAQRLGPDEKELATLLALVSGSLILVAGLWGLFRFRTVRRRWTPEASDNGQLATLMTELRSRPSATPEAAVAAWRAEAERAFVACDFLRVVAAARLCLGEEPGDRYARMLLAVAGAYHGDPNGATVLRPLTQGEGLVPSLGCALGWIAVFENQWQDAEAYFLDVLRHRPKEPAYWKCLAYAQWRRGKSLEAVRSARKALSLAGDNAADERALLARILVDLGRPLHAVAELDQLPSPMQETWQLRVARLRAVLLLRRFAEAEQLSAELDTSNASPLAHLAVARAFLEAEQEEAAEQRAAWVCGGGFYPEAHVLRAQLAAKRNERGVVYDELRKALDLSRPVASGAVGPFHVLDTALELLRSFEPPVTGIGGWGYVLDTGIGMPRQYLRVVACDVTWEQADARIRWLCHLLFPQRDPVSLARCLTPVADPIRPEGLVAPGLYGAEVYQ